MRCTQRMCGGPECRCSHLRAYADEHAVRVNRAVVLLRELPPGERGAGARDRVRLVRASGTPACQRGGETTRRCGGAGAHSRCSQCGWGRRGSAGRTLSAATAEAVRAYVERRLNPAREPVFVPVIAGMTFAGWAGFARLWSRETLPSACWSSGGALLDAGVGTRC